MKFKFICLALLVAWPAFAQFNFSDPSWICQTPPPPAGVSYSPTNGVSGCVLWLPPESLSALSDGNNVSTWSDWSGNGNNATAAGGSEPVYNTSQLGSYAAVNFTAANSDYLTANAVSGTFSGTDKNVTVFLLMKIAAQNTSYSFFGAGSSSTSTPHFDIQTTAASLRLTVTRRTDDSTSTIAGTVYTGFARNLTNYTLVTLRFSGSACQTYTNNVLCHNLSGLTTGKAMTVDRFSIGSKWQTSASDFFGGGIADVVVFNTALSDADKDGVSTNYFKAKYNLW